MGVCLHPRRVRRMQKSLWDSYFFVIGPFSKPYAGRSHISPSQFQRSGRRRLAAGGVAAGMRRIQENHTMDFAVLAITALFFALALAYVALCEKL